MLKLNTFDVFETTETTSLAKSYTFDSDEEGWQYGAIAGVYAEPEHSYSGGALNLKTTGNNGIVGWWGSPAISLNNDTLYKAGFFVKTDEADLSKIPAFRVRVNSGDYQLGFVANIDSQGSGESSPAPQGKWYSVYFYLPEGVSNSVNLFIDMTNFNPDDSGTATLMLDEAKIEEVKLDSWKANLKDFVTQPPAVADIVGDGRLETVVSSYRGSSLIKGAIFVFNTFGQIVGNWPQDTKGNSIPVSVSIADIAPNSGPEILRLYQGVFQTRLNEFRGGVEAFSSGGTSLFPAVASNDTQVMDCEGGQKASVSVGEIVESSGGLEFAAPSHGRRQVSVYSPDGTKLAKYGTCSAQDAYSWPYNDPYDVPLPIVDFDGDGKNEIVNLQHTELDILGWVNNQLALKYKYVFSTAISASGTGYTQSGAAIGDVLGNASPEIVFSDVSGKVYIIGYDGTPNLTVKTLQIPNGTVLGSPAIADLDNDGKQEIIIGDKQGGIHIIRAETSSVSTIKEGVGAFYSTPAIANVDSDLAPEIIIGSADRKIYALNANGSDVSGWPKQTGNEVWSSAAVADLDNDGFNEVVIGSDDGWLYFYRTQGDSIGLIYRADWPMYAHDLQHTAFSPLKYAHPTSEAHFTAYATTQIYTWVSSSNFGVGIFVVRDDADYDGYLDRFESGTVFEFYKSADNGATYTKIGEAGLPTGNYNNGRAIFFVDYYSASNPLDNGKTYYYKAKLKGTSTETSPASTTICSTDVDCSAGLTCSSDYECTPPEAAVCIANNGSSVISPCINTPENPATFDPGTQCSSGYLIGERQNCSQLCVSGLCVQ